MYHVPCTMYPSRTHPLPPPHRDAAHGTHPPRCPSCFRHFPILHVHWQAPHACARNTAAVGSLRSPPHESCGRLRDIIALSSRSAYPSPSHAEAGARLMCPFAQISSIFAKSARALARGTSHARSAPTRVFTCERCHKSRSASRFQAHRAREVWEWGGLLVLGS